MSRSRFHNFRLTLAFLGCFAPIFVLAQDSSFTVSGFFTEYGVETNGFVPADIPAWLLTDVNYAFSVPRDINGDGLYECTWGSDFLALERPMERLLPGTNLLTGEDKGTLNQLRVLKRNYPEIKIHLSVGGACVFDPEKGECVELAPRFKKISSDSLHTRHFVSSCVDRLVNPLFNDSSSVDLFDGLDLDWEFPVAGDTGGFTSLVRSFRRALNAASSRTGKNYMLSIDGAASPYYLNHINISAIEPLVDRVNVMAYGLYLPQAWSPVTGHHAATRSAEGEPLGAGYNVVDMSIAGWINGGIPPHKLVLGVPYFGAGYTGVEPGEKTDAPGRFVSFSGPLSWKDRTDGTIPFYALENWFGKSAGFTTYFDEEAGVPFRYNRNTKEWISHDDKKSLVEKTTWARQSGLGGMFVWELGQESDTVADKYVLTAAIADAAGFPERKPVADGKTFLSLSAAHPNPFSEQTQFTVRSLREENVSIDLFDEIGRRVRRLFDGTMLPNQVYTFAIQRDSLSAGSYLYRAKSGETETSQLVVIKD